MDAYVSHMRENEFDTAGFLGECTPGYFTTMARKPKWALFRGYLPGWKAFQQMLTDWRARRRGGPNTQPSDAGFE